MPIKFIPQPRDRPLTDERHHIATNKTENSDQQRRADDTSPRFEQSTVMTIRDELIDDCFGQLRNQEFENRNQNQR
ncbi:hypothetical protein D3C73_1334350 [compost metagenome]